MTPRLPEVTRARRAVPVGDSGPPRGKDAAEGAGGAEGSVGRRGGEFPVKDPFTVVSRRIAGRQRT